MEKSYISQVQLNPKLSRKDFQQQGYTTAKDANTRVDSIWQQYRSQELSSIEKNTYIVVDSIGQKNKFDTILKGMEALASGRWEIGKIDFLLHKVLGFNDFENTRFGGGVATNDNLSPFFELGGYAGYGIDDKAWKYGGYLLFDFLPNKKLQLKLNYQQDIYEAGIANFTGSSTLFSRRLYADLMDTWENRSVHLQGKLWQFAYFNLHLSQNTRKQNYEYTFAPDFENSTFRFTEVGLNLRVAFAERVVNFLGTQFSETRFPLIYFAYKKGFNGWLDGQFDYQKILFAIEDDFRILHFGETSFRIEAGQTIGELPYNQLFTSSGIGRGFQLLEIDHTFQTMDQYEFLSDRFINLFFQHNFGTLLFKWKNFKPEFSIVQNIGYGNLKNPELHQDIEFKTMEKGFFESGLRIDNLLKINYLNLMYLGFGGGIYYRYGDYAFAQTKDNLAYRLRLKFTF